VIFRPTTEIINNPRNAICNLKRSPWVIEKDRRGNSGSHTDPNRINRIRGPDRDCSNRQREKKHASGDRQTDKDRWPKPSETIRVLQSDGPEGLEHSSKEQIEPGHSAFKKRRLVLAGYGAPRPELQWSCGQILAV